MVSAQTYRVLSIKSPQLQLTFSQRIFLNSIFDRSGETLLSITIFNIVFEPEINLVVNKTQILCIDVVISGKANRGEDICNIYYRGPRPAGQDQVSPLECWDYSSTTATALMHFWPTALLLVHSYALLHYWTSELLLVHSYALLHYWTSALLLVHSYLILHYWSSALLLVHSYLIMHYWTSALLLIHSYALLHYSTTDMLHFLIIALLKDCIKKLLHSCTTELQPYF